MNVIHISLTPLAGAPIRIASALNKWTDFKSRLIDFNPKIYGNRTFPEDLIWEKDKDECLQLITQADILHFHHFFDIESENNPFVINFKKLAPNAKIIRHFHSGLDFYLRNGDNYIKMILNDKYPKLVIPHCPERTFLDVFVVPNIIPINDDILTPKKVPETFPLKIFYSASTTGSMWCSRWNTKGYPEIIKKISKLRKKSNFDFITVTNLPYEKCQLIKQNSNIVIGDITSGSYHLTDLESLSMGKPTFTYLDSRTQLTLTNLLGCSDLPFINTRIEEIDLPFLELINDRILQKEIGEFSRYWIEKYYNERKLVIFYKKAYEKVLNGEPLKRQGYLEFGKSKRFLYNDLYDLQWETRKKLNYIPPRGCRHHDHNILKLLVKYRKIAKNILENIFSVKNEYRNGFKRKVIRIFGLKLSFYKKSGLY